MNLSLLKGLVLGLISCSLCITSISGQKLTIPEDAPKSAIKAYRNGQKSMKVRELDKALKYFDKAIDKYPDFQSAKILKASIWYNLKNYEGAGQLFDEVISSGEEIPHKVYLTQGIIQYKLDNYAAARDHLQTFFDQKSVHEDLKKKAGEYLKASTFAAEAVKNPVVFNPDQLPTSINTKHNEYSPSITANGKRMIFSRRVGGYEYLMESERVNGVWQEAQSLKLINDKIEGGAHSISADGRFLVFTSCDRRDGFGSCDLFYSRFRRGEWTEPRNMGRPINTSAWDSQPALANNGRTLYFSSNRKGTIGAKDIWVSYRKPDNSWTIPRNLGPDINTKDNEKTPFIHFDNETMYFMSNGYPGMGDFDLFQSTRLSDTSWSQPVNLGYPINTKFHEGTMIIDLSGQKGYLTSDRHHSKALNKEEYSQTETDIFEFDVPVSIRPNPSSFIEILVVDAETQKPVQAALHITSFPEQKSVYKSRIQRDGYELVSIQVGQDYSIQVSHPDYTFFSERVQLKNSQGIQDPYEFRVELEKPATVEKPIVLKNVLFETNSSTLLPEADQEIDFLAQWLKDHPEASIEIRGHTDNVGDVDYNKKLSSERAQTVVQRLKEKGIEEDRLSWQGFGEELPIADNDTEEGRALNRRTEFIVKRN